MKKILAFLAMSLSILQLHAQENSDTLLTQATLDECIRYALEHQPAVKQSTLQQQIVDYDIRGRLADWYPQIGGAYSFQHNFQRSTSFFNGVATPVGVKNTSTAQLYLDQTIFNRDVIFANRTQATSTCKPARQPPPQKLM